MHFAYVHISYHSFAYVHISYHSFAYVHISYHRASTQTIVHEAIEVSQIGQRTRCE